MYNRRDFITVTAASAAAALLGCTRTGRDGSAKILPEPLAQFPDSMSTAARRELDAGLRLLAGDLPSDLTGHAFTIGSVPMSERGPQVVGDGIVYRLSFGSNEVQLKSRLMKTDCYLLDQATLDDPELGFQDQTFIRSSPAFGVRNFANTAFQPIQDGRMIVTYDAGRPWEIDPHSLDVITPIGLLDCWTPFLPPVTPALNFFPLSMTSAHPAYDEASQITYLVNFAAPVDGLNAEPFTRVLWWDGTHEPEACDIVDADGNPAVIEMACHQMMVTDQYLILVDTAFQLEAETFFGADPITRPALPQTAMWIIPKADLVAGAQVTAQRAVVPTEGAHAIALRNDDDGVISVLVAHQNSFDFSEWIAPTDVVVSTGQPVSPEHVGLLVQPADRSMVGRYRIDAATGEVLESQLFQDPESWAFVLFAQDHRAPKDRFGNLYWATFGFDPELLTERYLDAYATHPDRQVALADLPNERLPSQIVRFDADAFEVEDRFVMPLGYIGISPTFVPRKGGGVDEGYTVLFVVSDQGDEVWVFDSQNLAEGPLCRLGHPELDFGFTLHTTWMPEVHPKSAPTYRAEKRDDYEARIARLPTPAQNKAREVLGL